MPTFTWDQREALDPRHCSGLGSKVRGERIEAALVLYPAGTEVRLHASPHEQVHSILRGKASYRVDGEERLVGAGEAVLIRENAVYAVRILEDLEVVAFNAVQAATGARNVGSGGVFFRWDEMKSDLITPAYSSGRGPTITGERIEVAFMFYPAGTEAKAHSHPNEQIQVVLGGKVRAFIDGEEHVIGPGGGVLFPPNVEHGLRILEDYTLLNCKDIVQGWSVYHARWEKT